MFLGLQAAFDTELDRLTDDGADRLGLAVSGGGDSMALLHLAHVWARQRGQNLSCVSIDHGLRPEAAAEAAMVGTTCRTLDIPHQVLCWRGWDGRGNLQDAARRARQALIADWAQERGIAMVALGHTADDQAETVLLRLARGSGVDGLAGMRARVAGNPTLLRPLLDMRRVDLRLWLTERGIGWVDDPSNDDPHYDRVRARQMLTALGDLGLGTERLVSLAAHMRGEAEVLAAALRDFALRVVRQDRGDLLIDTDAFAAAPLRLRTRLLGRALQWQGQSRYPPRFDALHALAERPTHKTTVNGCVIWGIRDTIRIAREYAAVRDLTVAADDLWDGRWRINGPVDAGMELRALGQAGLSQCPDWRATGLPRISLLASPALWSGDTLISAPFAAPDPDWRVENPPDFIRSLLSH